MAKAESKAATAEEKMNLVQKTRFAMRGRKLLYGFLRRHVKATKEEKIKTVIKELFSETGGRDKLSRRGEDFAGIFAAE